MDDAYLEYAGDFFSFVIGENNVTAPLEDRTSSLDIPFIERSSMINTFGYGRAAGVAFLTNGANWMAAAGVYGDSLNNQDANFNIDESTPVSGRFTWAPIFENSPEGKTLVHLGLTARQRYIADDARHRYPHASAKRPRQPPHRRRQRRSPARATPPRAWSLRCQCNQFGFTAEYAQLEGTETPPAACSDFDFDGYYVDAYWSLTGEPRNYRGNTGSFGAIMPRHADRTGRHRPLDAVGALRLCRSQRSRRRAATRGEQSAYALGLDWIPIDHVRFKLNYAMSEMDRTGPGALDIEAPKWSPSVRSSISKHTFAFSD